MGLAMKGRMFGPWWRRAAAVAAIATLVPALTAAMPPKAYKGRLWVPRKPQAEKTVPGHPLSKSAGAAARKAANRSLPHQPGAVPARTYRAPAHVSFPSGHGTAWLGQVEQVNRGPLTGQVTHWAPGPQSAGQLPVSVTLPASGAVRSADAGLSPGGVQVAMARPRVVSAAGVHGVIMTLSPVSGPAPAGPVPAGPAPAGPVTVRLDYREFAAAYGGDWASRLRLVELPACSLTTPSAPGCEAQTPVPAGNDYAAGQVWAKVTLPGSVPAAGSPQLSRGTSGPDAPLSGDVVLATETSPGGPDGTYAATSLDPAGTWEVQDGDFTYDYPIAVPPSLGGAAPSVALDYDSQSVDGETSGSNTQGGSIGDGWNYSPGFIERSYQPCSQSGVTALASSDDLCWDGYNATLSMPGHSSILVQNGTSGAYRLQDDDGSSVQLYQDGSNGSNGLWKNEYWVVTTTDGTKYYFGADHVPGFTTSPATNSAWGVPVYNPVTGDPCYSSTNTTNSWCTMGYRWNLDFVVNPQGNLTEYTYGTETNYYNRGAGQATGNNGTLTSYVRAGYPMTASYGMLLSEEQSATPVKPAAEVVFGNSQRCLTPAATCASYSNLNSMTAKDWPDVPFTQICASSGSCSNWGPTFFSTYRLTSITTEVLPSQTSTYTPVDTYTLTQSFPVGATAGPVMFLKSILRTGNDGGTAKLPAVSFTAEELDNRVPGSTATPVDRPRIEYFDTETGERVTISYRAPDCTQGTGGNVPPSEPDGNTLACYPVTWTPPGVDQSPIHDWFIKSLVSQVGLTDETGADSTPQVTNYTYLGKAAWHWDQSPVITKANRLWDEWRGYQQVETQSGAAPDPVTETIDTYMQGMYGDETSAGGTTTTQVTDPNGDVQNDFNWLYGKVIEADTYNLVNGTPTIEKKAITTWPGSATQTASQAEPSGSGLSALTADLVAESQSATMLLQSDNTTYKSDTDTTYYNGDALPQYVDHKPQALTETCTTTAYANPPTGNGMMEDYPDQITTVTGAYSTTSSSCPTATSGNVVADTRTYYDDQNGSLTSFGTLGSLASPGGLVTCVRSAATWPSGGSEGFQSQSAATYDKYGRTLTQTDANGNTTTTGYSPATEVLATSSTVTNPKGWATVTALNQGRQEPTSVTDVNSEVTTETYDGLGRLTSVTTPLDQGTGDATYTYAYNVTGTAPSTVTTGTLREDGSYSESVSIYDGMAQLRQVQTTPADNAAGRLITDTFYDSHGWVNKTSAAYYESTTSPDTTLYVAADNSVPSQTVTTYDELGLPVASEFYSLAQPQWQTTTAYLGMNQVDVTPPKGGTASSTFLNVLGEKTASWQYDDSATPTDTKSDAVVTSYGYNPAGEETSVTDANGNEWTYDYNLIGQQTSVTDPGTGTAGSSGQAGTTSYTYDADGNVLSVTDPMSNVLTFKYDALGRKTSEYNSTPGVPGEPVELASWAYDTLEKGQLTSSTSYDSSGEAYTEAVTGYNAAYQPTGTQLTVPADAGALKSGTTGTQYTTFLAYTPLTGLPEYTGYTADGGLQSELIDYTYDLEGLLTQFGSGTAYLDNTTFTPQGQVTSTTFGAFGSQLVQDYNYDAGTSRLLDSTTNLQTLTEPADVNTYTYDQQGNITSADDQQYSPATQAQLQCYQYDNLDQLKQAWTDSGTTTTQPGPSVSGIGGCTNSSPAATTIGGVAPYWQSNTYDLLGDRSEEISHDTASVSQDTTANETTQQVAYSGATTTSSPYTQATGPEGQPDAAPTISTSGPGGSVSTTDTYNADGQLTSVGNIKTGSSPPAAPPGATIKYNVLGEVSSVTVGTSTTNYLYDANGNLLLQSGSASSTLYVDGGAEEITATGSTLSGIRIFSDAPDGTTVDESSTGTITYQVVNQQSTSLESINASTLAISRRYDDPWGNQVGGSATWPDNLGYIGQPTEPLTGFDLLGARQYDPVTGSFTSLDPVFEAGDPRQMGGYAYSADNPVTGSDPTGLYPYITSGGGCTGSISYCEGSNGGDGGTSGGSGGYVPVSDPGYGCPDAYAGCQIGPNWEAPLVTRGPTTISDTTFLTVTVSFEGDVGSDNGSPYQVYLGKGADSVESCKVTLPDGAVATIPTEKLFNDLSSEEEESGCDDCLIQIPLKSAKVGGFECDAMLGVDGAGALVLTVDWDGSHGGFAGSGELDVALTYHPTEREPAYVLRNPPPYSGDIEAPSLHSAVFVPTNSSFNEWEQGFIFRGLFQSRPPGSGQSPTAGGGESGGEGSENNTSRVPCTVAKVRPSAGSRASQKMTVVLTACDPDGVGGNDGDGDGEGDGDVDPFF